MNNHFEPLNKYFDKIFVLSLPRLTDRLAELKKNLSGLNYELFEGLDKNEITIDEMRSKGLYSKEYFNQLYPGIEDMHPGMLCCALGHVNIYKKIIEMGYNKTLILEDDVIADDHAVRQFPSIITELPSDWELFYLGYEKNEQQGLKEKIKQLLYYIFPPYSKFKIYRKYIKRYYPITLSTHIARAGFHDCSHAYAVTPNGAKKLLAHQQPVKFNSDSLLSHLVCTGQINGYIARPTLFNQLSAFINKVKSLTSG